MVPADFGPFVAICASALGVLVESVVGAGLCYPYLELVAGTFAGVLIGDVVLAPFSGR